jgi:hypothetical protein
MKASKSFCTNQWLPHPSLSQWELKINCHLIGFRMRLLEPNETQEIFHPPIKEDDKSSWLMGFGGSNLRLILDILMRSLELDPYLFRPLTLTSYFFILITSSN